MKKVPLLFTAMLFASIHLKAQTWDERPAATYDSEYSQEFNPTEGWDALQFYGQWNTSLQRIFNAGDISTGALQFQWIDKRIICSKSKYIQPYIFETNYDYSTGSNRGGIIIRINTHTESIQEPDHDPGFNREGIAFYPTEDGSEMIVQFSGEDKGANGGTEFARVLVPKPVGVTSLLGRGTLRIEDFGTSIFVFYNDAPFIRIDLDGLTEDIFTTGTVYDASMQVQGSFTGMEVEEKGYIAVAERDALLRLYSASIKYNDITDVFNPDDEVIFESPYRDLYTDTWVATDALGRTMPDANAIGDKSKKRRTVGIFYITWHTEGNHTNYPAPYANDVTKILETDPNARLDANHPLWSQGQSSYHWGEPEMGYFLSQDEYVIRKDMAMLANAGVDVLIMDVTNAVRYWDEWEVLFSTMLKIQAEGNKVPKFCFWAFNGPVISVVQDLYEGFYKTERYKDLWFYWDDKPLLLYNANPTMDATGNDYQNPNPNYDPDAVTNPDNPNYGDPDYTYEFYTDYTQEVKDFFSTRNMWWGYYQWAGERFVGTEDNWSFGYDLGNNQVKSLAPEDLIATHNGIKEQAAVTPAQHSSSMIGKSWSRANGEPELNEYDMPVPTYVPWLDQTVENPEDYGIYFQERWDETIPSDPEFIYINDWNEWTAGKYHDGGVNPFMRRNSDYYFVDQYNAEFTRGIQPMKGGYTDNYYMQMAQNIRKYKGVREHTIETSMHTISVDNDFADWEQVTKEFRDAIGDTRHRNHNGYGGLKYTNTTGRNDIKSSKVTYDNDNLYYYVKTVRDITSYDDANWMLLFIDADRNKATGWEGYDYIINKSVTSTTQTTLMKWTGLGWGNKVAIPYAQSGTEMEISIPRSALNMAEITPEFYFKWADNPQHLNDISAFSTDGETAPDRRFNYNYSTTDLVVIKQSPYKELNIPGTLQLEDFDNGSAGIAYTDAVFGNSGGAYRTDESVDIKEKAVNAYYITDIYTDEWLEYTVNVNATGLFTATIYYAADADNQHISLLIDNRNIASLTLPKTGAENDWTSIETDVRIKAGTQFFKVMADNVTGGLHIDKIVFTEKEVIHPDDGTGLYRTFYNGDIGGRNWFTETFCSEVDPIVNHDWNAGESPGCETRGTFWNARWEGELEAHFTEVYTISFTINHLGKLWIGEELIIDAWTYSDSPQTHVVNIDLTANEKVSIKIEYANYTGNGSIKLEWESVSQLKEVIPQSQLFPKDGALAIGDFQLTKSPVLIYPNPANDKLYIETAEQSKLEIYNLLGQKVYQQKTTPGVIEIDVSTWRTGVYVANTKSNQQVYIQKLIIK
jgi:hypothetical protein